MLPRGTTDGLICCLQDSLLNWSVLRKDYSERFLPLLPSAPVSDSPSALLTAPPLRTAHSSAQNEILLLSVSQKGALTSISLCDSHASPAPFLASAYVSDAHACTCSCAVVGAVQSFLNDPTVQSTLSSLEEQGVQMLQSLAEQGMQSLESLMQGGGGGGGDSSGGDAGKPPTARSSLKLSLILLCP